MSDATCTCGAVGRIIAPNFTYAGEERQPLMRWSGGHIGRDRVAIETARTGVSACPVCQHRACVFEPIKE